MFPRAALKALPVLLTENYMFVGDEESAKRTLTTPAPRLGSALATRRLQTLQYIIGALQKLAATRNCAVVILSQCATRMQSHSRGAALTPAINAGVWEQGIAARVVLFRDWVWEGGGAADTCFAGVQRVGGKKVGGALERVFAFRVGEVCKSKSTRPPRLSFCAGDCNTLR